MSETRVFELQRLLPAPYYCRECAERLCAATHKLTGVRGSACDAEAGALTVTFDPSAIASEELARELERLGLETVGAVSHVAYRLTGLD